MFSDDDTKIFGPFYDGVTRDSEGNLVAFYADPRAIERDMAAACGGEVDDIIELCKAFETTPDGKLVLDASGKPNRIQLPAVVAENYRKLTNAICVAFGLQPFTRLTGQGATTAMCVRLWNEFGDFQTKNDLPDGSSPTSNPASPAVAV